MLGTEEDKLKTKKMGWFGGEQLSLFSSLFCDHDWEPYGSGLDCTVKCTKCGKIREERPGDLAPW